LGGTQHCGVFAARFLKNWHQASEHISRIARENDKVAFTSAES
jgi:hypothetical protein